MNIIYYNGCYIRDDGDGHYTAFFYDEDGDLNELTTKDLDKAKRVIDEHPFDENGEPYEKHYGGQTKVAKLVTFSITTRVVIESDGNERYDEEYAYSKAVKNIMSDIEGYLCMENLDSIDDDKEMPYDPAYDD